jgi:hypothetical protein
MEDEFRVYDRYGAELLARVPGNTARRFVWGGDGRLVVARYSTGASAYPADLSDAPESFSDAQIADLEGNGSFIAGVADDEPILVSACDNGVVYDPAKWAALVADPTVDVIVWSFRANTASTWNPDAYAWMLVDAAGQVRHVSCKKFLPEVHDLRRSHVIIGTMFFRKAAYFREGYEACVREGRRTKGEFYVDDVVNSAIKAGLSVRVFEADHYLCWGTPDDYRTYEYWRGHFRAGAGGAAAAAADFDDFAVWP